MTLRSILQRNSNIALVIGNGINRYNSSQDTNSWDDLLNVLAIKYSNLEHRCVPDGIALTELYDLLDLKSDLKASGKSLQKEFCDLMCHWKFHDHHKRIVTWAQNAQCPLLTTNFDKTLGSAAGGGLFQVSREGFTDFYPWDAYYGNDQLEFPRDGFGIWHINGMVHYQRSIRLGLSHYMGSVERARSWIHKGKTKRLFAGNQDWRGAKSWLDLIFHKSLLIFGLGLGRDEIFLRWLLIVRAQYFKRFPNRKSDSWYIYTDDIIDPGKLHFLDSLGVKPIYAANFDEIYGEQVWE